MAGGVNPFGFSMGVLPAPRAPRQPKDLPSAPFGFAPPPSKMQQTLAILNEYNPLPAFERLLKSPMALGGPISEQDIADGLMVSGTVTGGSAAAPKPKNALNMGIRAFHGSPHDFPPVRLLEMPDGTRLYQNMGELADTPQGARIIQEYPMGRFDLSKIGTGEGAQAYGHGLYFAGNEAIAKSYRDALAMKPLNTVNNAIQAAAAFSGDNLDISQMRDWLVREGFPRENITPEIVDLSIRAAKGQMADGTVTDEALRAYRALEPALGGGKGHMYEVEINADPDNFFDWDKPLLEQSDFVRDALNTKFPHSNSTRKLMSENPLGRDFFGEVGDKGDYFDHIDPSERLKTAGIPGIKYLDAGSRAAGDGSRNYVVFDDRLVSIVRKYGIAGASAMLGYNILDGMDPAQAEELQRIEGNQ
jgi:hypothetical protein